MSWKLGELIQRAYPDMKIIYTREKDVSVALRARGEIANKAKAQLFISIHANSVKDPRPRGTEVFVLGLHASEASLQVAMRENLAIRYEADYAKKYSNFNPEDMASYILFNHLRNTFLSNSIALAAPIHDEIVKTVGLEARGVKQAGFLVLKDVAMPAVLVETGFISNASDLKKLTSTAGKEQIARSIFKAFVTYKEELERNSVLIQNTTREQQAGSPALVYAIQVAAGKNRITDAGKRFNLQDPVTELKTDDYYRYHVCACASYNEAVESQRKIRKSVKDCFVIALHDGKLIPLAKARQIENERKK